MDGISIRLETKDDYRTVEELAREAFWNVYVPGAGEHYLAHMMRNHPDFIPELDFVAEKEGKIVGSIMYTKAWLEGENGTVKEIVSCGLLCVSPEFQRRKIGKMLIEHSVEEVRRMGYDVIILFGNPGNYCGRGFISCKKYDVSFIEKGYYPTALLVRELEEGVLDKKSWLYISSTASDCCANQEAIDAFDASFPPKEKKWMPSQEEFYIYKSSSVVR